MTQINVWTLILILFGFSGICILLNLLFQTFRRQNSPNDLPIEVPRATFLVQGEPARNVSRDAILIVPYRNNTIQNPIEIDGAYIRVAEIQVGEKEIHPAAYAFMV